MTSTEKYWPRAKKKKRNNDKLTVTKRFAKSRSRRIYPAFQITDFVICGVRGSTPTSRKPPVSAEAEIGGFERVYIHRHCLPSFFYRFKLSTQAAKSLAVASDLNTLPWSILALGQLADRFSFVLPMPLPPEVAKGITVFPEKS